MKRPQCHVNVTEIRRRVSWLKAAKAAGRLAPVAPPAAPRVLAVRVDFPDKAMTKTLAQTQVFFSDMRNFYVENSFGLFTPTFTVTSSVYRLSSSMGVYGTETSSAYQQLFSEASTRAVADYSMTQFDHIMIYHAGHGNESTQFGAPEIWSAYIPDHQQVGGQVFHGFTVVPESEADASFGPISPLAVICHEYGHQLGLPDLYDVATQGGDTTVGSWDLMDYAYTGTVFPDGSNPPHLGAWSKKFLGWPTVAQSTGTIVFGPSETTRTAFNLNKVDDQEYFLVEYRWRDDPGATYDKGIPMSGLAIWHVDDNIALNQSILEANIVNTPQANGGHYGVDLVEADGVQASRNTDLFGNGNAFVDGQTFTSPQSDSFSGRGSGVTLTNISGVGSASVTSVTVSLLAAPFTELARVVNYPNPAGDTSKFPVRAGARAGTITTLRMQLSRPVHREKLKLDIYTTNGDRVLSVSPVDIFLQVGPNEPSDSYKWVYEYDWNGMNDEGDQVAPGVYFYRFTADSEVGTGKLIVLR